MDMSELGFLGQERRIHAKGISPKYKKA